MRERNFCGCCLDILRLKLYISRRKAIRIDEYLKYIRI